MSSNRLGIPQSSTVNDNFGVMILKPGTGELKKPTWDGKELWFRILPGVDPDDQSANPRLDPFRLQDGRFGQWFLPIRYANKVGSASDNRTFLLCDSLDATYDLNANPLVVIRKAIRDVIKNRVPGLNWAALIKYEQATKCEPVPAPKEGFLVGALILKRGGKDFVPPLGFKSDSPMQYLLLSKSTMNKLVDIFNEERKDYAGNSPVGGFIHDDPVSFASGLFLSTFRPVQQAAQQGQGWGAPVQPQQGQGGGEDYQSYDVKVLDLPDLAPYRDLTPFQSQIAPKLKKFSDIVAVPSHDEQVTYICETLGKTDPDVIVYALGDQYKHVIPPAIMEAGNQRLQMARGGYHPPVGVPAAGWGQPQPGYGQPQQYGQPNQAYPPQQGYGQPPQQYPPQAPAPAPAAPATGWGQPQAAPAPAPTTTSWGQPQTQQPGYGQPPVQAPVNGSWGQPPAAPAQAAPTQPTSWGAPPAPPAPPAQPAQPTQPPVPPQAGPAAPTSWGQSPPQAGAPPHVANPPELNGQMPAPGIAGSPIAPPGATPITQEDAMARMKALMSGNNAAPTPPAAV